MSFDRSLTRGPLPSSVYWRRRAAVLGMLLLLILGFTKLVGGSSDQAGPEARNASAKTTQVPVVPENIGAPVNTPTPSAAPSAAVPLPGAPGTTPVAPVAPATDLPQVPAALPTPTGRCSDDDVNVAVKVGTAEVTRTVPFALTLKTNLQAACLWTVSAKSIQVRVTSGSDEVWTTRDCPKAIPAQSVTLRRDTPITVVVKWNSRRSDATCSTHTEWAKLGYYHAQVAALGGEPTDVQFRLRKPTPVSKATPKAPAKAPVAIASPRGQEQPANGSAPAYSEPTSTPRYID